MAKVKKFYEHMFDFSTLSARFPQLPVFCGAPQRTACELIARPGTATIEEMYVQFFLEFF